MSQLLAPGFEPLREILDSSPVLAPGGAGFAACVDGELVVDIHTGEARPGLAWQDDTLVVLMSVTKGFAAFAAQLLQDRGQLDVDERVAHYWPEFGANGKSEITVRQVLIHTAGVIGFPGQTDLLRWDGAGWADLDAIAAGLAAAAPVWAPGTKHGYHAVTYGWLVGEVVRRIAGVTIGELMRAEVFDPLHLDIHIGADENLRGRVAQVFDFPSKELPMPMRLAMSSVNRQMRSPRSLLGQAFLGDGRDSIMSKAVEMLTDGKMLGAEVPASNGVATAGSLARFYAMLAGGGQLDGRRIVSEDSVRQWSELEIRAGDQVMTGSLPRLSKLSRLDKATTISHTLGYLRNDAPAKGNRPFGPTPTAIGAMGAGGQVAFADAASGVSAAFVRNRLSHKPNLSDQLFAAFYDCLPRAHNLKAGQASRQPL